MEFRITLWDQSFVSLGQIYIPFLQAGISRTTTAIVCGALVKELQLTRELDRMRGIVPDDILDALKKKKLGLPGIDIEVQEDRNAMQMGEFEVIKELLAAFPEAKVAKAQVSLITLMLHPQKAIQMLTFTYP